MSVIVLGPHKETYNKNYYHVNGMLLIVTVVANAYGKEISGVFQKLN